MADRDRMTRSAATASAPILLLGAAGALGSLAVHMVVPALPAITETLHISSSEAQLSISVYLVGLALGQLSAGGISDVVGRRPVLLGGIALFALASLAAALAGSLATLLVARFFQALGGAGGLIAGRTIVADSGDHREAPRRLAALSSLMLISPTIAPTIGGMIEEIGGWRTIFVVLTGAAIALWAIAFKSVPETWRRAPNVSPLRVGARLLGRWSFLRLALSNGLLSVALYAFLSVSPFLLIDRLDLSPKLAGFALLWIASFAIIGTVLHRSHAVSRYAANIGRGVALLGGMAFVASAWLLPMSPISLIAPMCLVTLGSGLSGPSILAAAITVDRASIGTASSIFGAIQMAMGAGGTALIAALAIDEPAMLGLIMLIAVAAAFVLLPRRMSPIDASQALSPTAIDPAALAVTQEDMPTRR